MLQDDQPKQQVSAAQKSPAYDWRQLRNWILGSTITLLFLMIASLFIVPQIINSALIKQKILEAVTEQTGGQIDYQAIDLSYRPRLAFELHHVKLAIPDQVQATVATLRVSPEFFPLLTGKLNLARLELETVLLNLELPTEKTKSTPAQPSSVTALEKKLSMVLEPLAQVIPGLELSVTNARLAVAQSKQKLFEIDGLNLQLEMSMSDPHSAQAYLQTTLSELSIFKKDHQETLKEIILSGKAQMMGGKMTITLDQLAIAEPSLELTGDLILASTTPAIILNLSSSNLDVDATRRTALSLAGETTPIKEIFNYLRGGQVPQITFTSKGDTPSELGDLNNILIKGRLQEGKVSIPEIELELTEVIGDVIVSKGVLQGTKMSTRLEGSTGHDGSLKVALGDDNDLFQLELMLEADLAKVQTILQRVVEAPAFTDELKRITKLQGTGQGRLTLGDDLSDVNAKVEISQLNLSAQHQLVPFPITIEQGQFTFNKKQSTFGKLTGTVGKSKFSDLSCQLRWEKNLFLDISSGQFNLVMAEIYPWLANMVEVRDYLKEVTKVTGRIDLAALKLKGPVDKPSDWQFSSSGTAKDISIDTELFPNTINIAKGGFKVDTKQVAFKQFQTSSQNTTLNLSGSLKGFPQHLDRVELSIDGRMGPKSVEWLSDKLEVPKTYAINTPVNISKAHIDWQPDSTASFNGAISIVKGPAINIVVNYHPEQLQIPKLSIKDQHSDASMALDFKKDQHNIKFKGKLQHETLQALFADSQFRTGQLEGDFALAIPQPGPSKATANGQLTGKNLMTVLASGEKVDIEQVTLQANGPQIAVDIAKLKYIGLTWEPVRATVFFDQNEIDINFSEAKICGIDSPGEISIIGDEFSLDMTLEGKGLDVATSYSCLREGQVKMTGTLDFSSQVTAKGQIGDLVNSLQGPLQMTFTKGVIEQDKMMARTLEVLNVTEIVKGRLPNLSTTGFPYTTIEIEGKFQNGKLIFPKLFMDGETLDLLGHGEIGLEEATIDGQLLAAPLKTIDSVLNKIPGISYLLGGGLVTIPVGVTGSLNDPQVSVMSASAVGTSLLDLGERIFKSPFKLVESLLPWSNTDKK